MTGARTMTADARSRRPTTAVASVALLLAALCLLAVPVSADTDANGPQLRGTMPPDAGEVARPPEVVRAVFGAPVDPVDDGIEVLDDAGDRVDEGPSDPRASPVAVEAVLPPDLPAGAYEATWRVHGTDGQPVQGSWSFVVLRDPEEHGERSRGPWIVVAVLGVLLAGSAVQAAWRRP